MQMVKYNNCHVASNKKTKGDDLKMNSKTKKMLGILTAIMLSASLLAGCGGSSTSSSAAESGSASSGETSVPAVEPVEGDIGEHSWNLGMDSPAETATSFYGKTFAQQVSQLSGGKMTIEVYTDATLGGDVALLESCNAGDVTFVVQNTAPQVNFIPELGVFDMPMVYKTIEEFRAVFQDENFMGKISAYYDAAGYKLLGYADQTFRVMSSNKKVESIADFAGIKIRTMENPNHMAAWEAYGAAPTPMAFSELYTGLQQGTVDAQENPYAVIAANKLYEVQDYVIQTNHLPHILSLIMDPVAFDGLNADEQAIITQAAKSAVEATFAEADRLEAEKIAEIEASGTEIVPVSDELYSQMREAVQPVYDKIAEQVGQDLVDAYMGK